MHSLDLTEEVVDIPGTVRITGKIVARNVPYEQFMETEYGERHVEWVNGVVIEMPGIEERHDALVGFLRILFSIYLELTGGGRVFQDPMLMKLESVPSSRAPDIQVLLPVRLHQLKKNQVVGAANLVVEIVSPGSQRQDRVEKRREYELGGVPEYWLIDPQKQESIFSQLNESGIYETIELDASGIYHSRSLPRLHFPVALLWRETLPTVAETMQMIEAMLK